MRTLSRTVSLPLVFWPLAILGQTTPQPASNNPVAVIAGQPISEEELVESLGAQWLQLRSQEYEAKSKALEGLIRHRVVEAEARKRNITAEKLIEREVDSKVTEPTDGEVEAYFLGQNRTGTRFEEVKEQYRNSLRQIRLVKARQAYADILRAKSDVAVLLRPPTVEVAVDPKRVKGDPHAPVTIVEFSDFQCPFCIKVEPTMKEILKKYDGRVKLAYRDFPLLEVHPRAEKAAEAARCAAEQGKFWEFHDALFANQSKLSDADLISDARSLGLEEQPFQSCLASERFKTKIEADLQDGAKVGIAGTPGFFVNGVFLSGAQPQAEFEKIIDAALAAAKDAAHLTAKN
jgi:protein-disulfide isomerase